jgi:hypothetical protein
MADGDREQGIHHLVAAEQIDSILTAEFCLWSVNAESRAQLAHAHSPHPPFVVL